MVIWGRKEMRVRGESLYMAGGAFGQSDGEAAAVEQPRRSTERA
jgi:hypothetical protein